MAAFPDRAANAIVLSAEHAAAYSPEVPATAGGTVATVETPAGPAVAPATAVTMAAHLAARQHPAVMTGFQGHARAASWRAGVEPFWSDMIAPGAGETDAPSSAAGGEQDESRPIRDRHVHVVPDPERGAAAAISGQAVARPGGLGGRWDLVVVEWGCRVCGDALGLLGADLLAPGGVLAVLTHSERRAGRLLDPTGSVVASAQAADLLYLQHIVLLTMPLHAMPPDTRPDAELGADTPPSIPTRGLPRHPEHAEPGAEPALGGGLMDLLLFLQPGAPSQSSALDEPPNIAPPATAEEAPAAVAATGHTANGGRA